jgi:hypothetical protein
MNIFFLTFCFIWFSWSHNSSYRFVKNVIIGCPSFPYALHLFFLHPEKKINSTLIIAQTIIYIIQEYHFLVQQKTLVRRTPFKEQCHFFKFCLSLIFFFSISSSQIMFALFYVLEFASLYIPSRAQNAIANYINELKVNFMK